MHSFRSLLESLPPRSRALEAREVRDRPTSPSLAACPSFAWSTTIDLTVMEALAATYQVHQVYRYCNCSRIQLYMMMYLEWERNYASLSTFLALAHKF